MAALLALAAAETALRLAGFSASRCLQPGPVLPGGPTLDLRGDESQKSRFLRTEFPILIRPPEGVRRVLFVGGSSTQGFPYPQHSFPASFQAALNPAVPVQSINLGALQFAARDEQALLEEVLRTGLRPDAVVIHSGNNELYYNRARVLQEMDSSLRRFLRALDFLRLAELMGSRLSGPSVPHLPYPLHLRYPLSEENLQRIARAYEEDMVRMVRSCRSRGVPVVLTTTPINRDYWAPLFCPHASLAPEEVRQLEVLASLGEEQFQAGDLGQAARSFQQVLARIPEEPKSQFYFGRIRLREGREADARQRLETALRRDILALRAIPDLNDRVRSLAQRFAGDAVYLLDFDQYFLDRYGLAGRGIFIDNCHGKLDTYLEMGVILARCFVEKRILADLEEAIPFEPVLERLRAAARISDMDLARVRNFVDSVQERPTPFVHEWHRDFEAYEAELRRRGILK